MAAAAPEQTLRKATELLHAQDALLLELLISIQRETARFI
jgi:hypothetical protein